MSQEVLDTLESYNITVEFRKDLSLTFGEYFYEAIIRGDYFVLPYIYQVHRIHRREDDDLANSDSVLQNWGLYLALDQNDLLTAELIIQLYGITPGHPHFRDDIEDNIIEFTDSFELDTIMFLVNGGYIPKDFLRDENLDIDSLIERAKAQNREDFIYWLSELTDVDYILTK